MRRQTLARGVLYLLSAEYSSNVRSLAENLSDLTVASSQYDTLLCSKTGLRYASRVGGPGTWFRSPCLVVSWQDASGPWDGFIRLRWVRSISPTQI